MSIWKGRQSPFTGVNGYFHNESVPFTPHPERGHARLSRESPAICDGTKIAVA
jgi:hypothetical protein